MFIHVCTVSICVYKQERERGKEGEGERDNGHNSHCVSVDSIIIP